jgi:hypothetical protein
MLYDAPTWQLKANTVPEGLQWLGLAVAMCAGRKPSAPGTAAPSAAFQGFLLEARIPVPRTLSAAALLVGEPGSWPIQEGIPAMPH